MFFSPGPAGGEEKGGEGGRRPHRGLELRLQLENQATKLPKIYTDELNIISNIDPNYTLMSPNNPTPLYIPTLVFLNIQISAPPLIWSELGRGSWVGEVGSLDSAHRGPVPFRWGGRSRDWGNWGHRLGKLVSRGGWASPEYGGF